MGKSDLISSDMAIWNINMFCIVPCISTYICMIINLYALMELNLCKGHRQNDSAKYMSKICAEKGKRDCLSFVNACSRMRNSVAHCNKSIIWNSSALRSIVDTLDAQMFKDMLIILIGTFSDLLNIDKLYINLCSYQLSWNPPLGSSKEVFEDYSRKMIELEEEIYKRRNSNEENKFS